MLHSTSVPRREKRRQLQALSRIHHDSSPAPSAAQFPTNFTATTLPDARLFETRHSCFIAVTPTGMAAPGDAYASPANAEVDLGWDADPNATSYEIFRGTAAGSESTTPIATVTTSTYSDTSLTNGDTYYYTIGAVNTHGTSATSAEVSATPLAPPAAPSGLSATEVSSSEIDLSWTDNSGGAGSFLIQRSDDGGTTFTPLDTVDAGTTSYQDTSVSDGTSYEYEVAAYNTAATSTFTSAASASTPLAAPDTLDAEAASTSEIDLSWVDESEAATSVSILRSTDQSTWTTVTTFSNNSTTTYSDTGLSSGQTYYYEILASTTAGSATSTIASATTDLGAPTGVTASASTSAVTVTWATVTGATGYAIERSGSDGEAIIGGTDAPGTSYSDSDVVQGHSYTYSVVAYDDTDRSDASSGTSVTVPLSAPSAPTGVAADALSCSSAEIVWQNTASNESGFILQTQNAGGSWSDVGSELSSTTLSDQVMSLTPNTSYTYRVESINSAGTGTSATVSVATPSAPLPDLPLGTITFRGGIDGTDSIHIKGDEVWIVHGDYDPAGTWYGLTDHNLYVNGVTGSASTTWTTGVGLGYSTSVGLSWQDEGLSGTSSTDPSQGTVAVTQEPSAANGYETVVYIDDDPPQGAHMYDVTVSPGTQDQPQVGIQAAEPGANAVGPDGKPQPDWFILSRTGGDLNQSLSVNLACSGDAQAGQDYAALPSTVTFAADQTSTFLEVDPLNTEARTGSLLTATVGSGSGYELSGNTQATESIAAHGLAVKLDRGEAYPVISKSIANGATSPAGLMPLYLTIPNDLPTGATVTLNNTGAFFVHLYSFVSGTLTSESTSDSISWTIGGSTVPTVLYVSATAPSMEVDDTLFTLRYTGGPTVTANPATVITLALSNANDPNDESTSDNINGATEDWMVGQMAEPRAILSAPDPLVKGASYLWRVPGYTDASYLINANGVSHEVHFYSHPNTDSADRTGAANFFWVNVGPNGVIGVPETVQVSAEVGAQHIASDSTVFDVYSPLVTSPQKPIPGPVAVDNLGYWGNPGWGMGVEYIYLYNAVSDPFWVSAGKWSYLQTAVTYESASLGSANYVESDYGKTELDGGFPLNLNKYNAIFDPATNRFVSGPLLPTDGTTYAEYDAPYTGLSGGTFDHVTRSDYFRSYVMYLPTGLDSQWVPLAVRSWGWQADAVENQYGGWNAKFTRGAFVSTLNLFPREPSTLGLIQNERYVRI